ncbi:MAG: hypothetical protein KME03_20390 [Aphanocapsa lilacina HA4352-LM1]|jgi:glutamine synthetase type III|nr:hypothetical protein [Aphanocapsa lilacina HA4352-LM1]
MEERMDHAEQRLDQHGESIAELRAATLANTRNLDRLTQISERFITVATDAIAAATDAIGELRSTTARLDQAVEELRASNRRQEAINDYLIRRERERGDGDGSEN